MAKVVNTFVKGKLNKDLDARLIPNGEYRDARNVQVSKSEGPDVGELENVLGNKLTGLTFPANSKCIGWVTDDTNNFIYLFVTDNATADYVQSGTSYNHKIYQYNTLTDTYVDLIFAGTFLNFSQLFPIYGVNIVENLLFWTDNRNQPRKINIERAVANSRYYQTEDQISVGKYNPYQPIQLWQESDLGGSVPYETTMKDVTSKTTPVGGTALTTSSTGAGIATIPIGSLQGVNPKIGQLVYYVDSTTGFLVSTGASVDTGTTTTSLTVGAPFLPALDVGVELVFDGNPYYNPDFAGDPAYLEDRFVRFSYRWRFDDNEYSIFAPFTQIAFIPKQDGYFMYTQQESPSIDKDDQAAAYRSTIVDFVENKVDEIKLIFPLPYTKFSLQDNLKIKELEILYKESDGLAVRVVDTIPINDIYNSGGIGQFSSLTDPTTLVLINSMGEFKAGDPVYGRNVVAGTKVVSYNSSSGVLVVDTTQTGTFTSNQYIFATNPSTYEYTYNSTKPFKTLPDSELLRVFDKVPVKAFAQEISGNRIIYGNFQNKHTPPESLDYNVQVSDKSDFKVTNAEATVNTGALIIPAGTNIPITVTSADDPVVGDAVYGWKNSVNAGDANGFLIGIVTSYSAPNLQLDRTVPRLNTGETLTFQDLGTDTDTTGLVEYPNSSVKQNRNYQVGVVFSDRFGRQSSVILSNNNDTVTVGSSTFIGDTVYAGYIEDNVTQKTFPGDSLKMFFNNPISPAQPNPQTGWPGLYNGDTTSPDYNPLGWYSYKIVVKQTEQEYYNVYLPGIMASYPQTGQGDTIVPTGGTYAVGATITLDDPHGIIQVGGIVSSETAGVTIPEGTKIVTVNLDANNLAASIELDQVVTLVDDTNLFITPSTVKEFGQTSHAVLINDNINKVPRDLSEVGPDQKQYRSSVRLFGRVENTNALINYNTDKAATNLGKANTQYYPGRTADTVSTISTMYDLFNYNPLSQPRPNDFPQFYLFESNPLIARISTENKIGQLSTTNYITVSGTILTGGNIDAGGDVYIVSYTGPIFENYIMRSVGIPEGTYVTSVSGPAASPSRYTIKLNNSITILDNEQVEFTRGFASPHQGEDIIPGLEYLAVYETSPVISNLDIYWETTTAGLISDLNHLILSKSDGGADIDSFDTSWTEVIASGADILASDFNVVNQFGVNIPNVLSGGVTQLDVTLTSVVDATNQGNDVSDYFTLTQSGGVGTNGFNIETTGDYFNNVFFGNDSAARLFTFELLIETTINGEPSVVTVTRNNFGPINKAPQITSLGTNPVYTDRTNTSALTTINSHNGAANTTLRTQDYSVSITELTKNGNPIGQDENISDYFTLSNSVVATQLQSKFFIASPTIAAADYNLTLEFADTGEAIESVYQVKLNRAVYVSNYEKTTYLCDGDPSQCNTQSVVRFQISGSPVASENGYYYYGAIPCTNPDDATLQLANGTSGDNATLTINKTSANPGPSIENNGQLYFSTTSFADTETLFLQNPSTMGGNDCCDGSGFGCNTGLGTFVAEDISAYAVEII